MSKGPGHIERTIRQLFDGNPEPQDLTQKHFYWSEPSRRHET